VSREIESEGKILIYQTEKGDTKIDVYFENDTILSLEEGLSELEGCIAYPFEHEGFSKEESKILENLFSEFTGTKFAD